MWLHRFVHSVLFVAVVLSWSGFSAAQQPTNFIVFLADDLGWGDLGCYGHPVIKTPNLDRFAKEGLKLNQCYSACSVCSPSRSAILTGRTPYRNGVWRWIPEGSRYHLRTSEISIAKLLKQRGYDTCHVGKWHLNGLFNSPEQPQPNAHGYDHWLATQNNAAPNHLNPTNFVRNGQAAGRIEGPSSTICVNEAAQWLAKRQDKEKPFFLTVWTHEPHLPIESADEFMRPYANLADPNLRQHHGNVTQMDAAFGKLMATIEQMGYRDNTLVIFTADNGPEGAGDVGRTRGSTGGLRGRKRHTFEGGIRVAGLVRWPGKVQSGTESTQPVIGTDIFATICDVTGIELPKDRVIDGASWTPMFSGETISRTQPLYWRNHLAPEKYMVAMRDGDWKILGSNDLTSFALYNLRDDAHETQELSAKFPEKYAELKQRLITYDRSVLADGPDWWKDNNSDAPEVSRQQKAAKKSSDSNGR